MYFASKGIQKSCIWTIIFKYTKILNEVNCVHLMNELILDMVSLDTTEVFSSPNGTWSFTIFPLVVSHTTSITCISTCGACLKVVFDFERRATRFVRLIEGPNLI